jgi:CheY-like chemotaxis protein
VAETAQTILVVDDDLDVLDLTVSVLAEFGFRLVGASDPLAALDVIRDQPDIDLLFTDIVMPGAMSGFALARAARKLRPDLPVLYTSGFSEDIVDGVEGEGQLIPKPWRADALHLAVREALAPSPRC